MASAALPALPARLPPRATAPRARPCPLPAAQLPAPRQQARERARRPAPPRAAPRRAALPQSQAPARKAKRRGGGGGARQLQQITPLLRWSRASPSESSSARSYQASHHNSRRRGVLVELLHVTSHEPDGSREPDRARARQRELDGRELGGRELGASPAAPRFLCVAVEIDAASGVALSEEPRLAR